MKVPIKIILTIVLIILFSQSLRAEYEGHIVSFIIESTDAKKFTGFARIPAGLNPDSLKSTEFLKRALGQSWRNPNERDSVIFFENRIKYNYKNVGDNSGRINTEYYLINKQAIPFQKIITITIVEMTDYSYMNNI